MKVRKVELKLKNFNDIKKVLKANTPVFFIIALLIFVTYINGINGAFISDDIPGILKNPNVQDFGRAVSRGQIQNIIQSAIFNIFGENPVPFHAFSMVFHFVNVILFFVVVYNLFNKKVAAYASVLYAIHPVTAETVLWMSALNYLINTFILFTTTIIYLIYRKTDNKRLLFIITGYMTVLPFTFINFWIYVIPFFILTIELLFLQNANFKKMDWKKLLYLSPLFLISLANFLYRAQTQVIGRVGSLATPDATPYLNRIPFTFYMAWEMLVWPKDLTIYHEGQIITTAKYVTMAAVAVITVVGTLLMLKKEKHRIYGALIALTFIATLPVFSPVQVAWFVAERYLYVSVGVFCILLAMLILAAEKKFKKKNLALILTSLLLVAYSARGIARTYDWKTRKSLWLATEAVGFYSARVHNNLGDVYGLEKNWAESIRHFELAIKIKPTYSEAIHNLGNTYMQLGQLDKAEETLKQSLEINPNLYQSIHKLGLIEYNKGNVENAKQLFRETLQFDPNYLPAIEALQILQQRNL